MRHKDADAGRAEPMPPLDASGSAGTSDEMRTEQLRRGTLWNAEMRTPAAPRTHYLRVKQEQPNTSLRGATEESTPTTNQDCKEQGDNKEQRGAGYKTRSKEITRSKKDQA